MTDNADEVNSILVGKTVSKYSGPETDAMKALANAAKKRSLKEFNEVFLIFYSVQLSSLFFRLFPNTEIN